MEKNIAENTAVSGSDLLLEGVSPEVRPFITTNMLANPRLQGLGTFNPLRSAYIAEAFDNGRKTLALTISAQVGWLNAYCAAHGITPVLKETVETTIMANDGPALCVCRVELFFDGNIVGSSLASNPFSGYLAKEGYKPDEDRCANPYNDLTLVQSTCSKAKRRVLADAGFALLDDQPAFNGSGLDDSDLPFSVRESNQATAPAPVTTEAAEPAPKKRGRRKSVPADTSPESAPAPAEATPVENSDTVPGPSENSDQAAPDANGETKADEVPPAFVTDTGVPDLSNFHSNMTLEEALAFPCEMPYMKGEPMEKVYKSKGDVLLNFWASDRFYKPKYAKTVEAVKVILKAKLEGKLGGEQ